MEKEIIEKEMIIKSKRERIENVKIWKFKNRKEQILYHFWGMEVTKAIYHNICEQCLQCFLEPLPICNKCWKKYMEKSPWRRLYRDIYLFDNESCNKCGKEKLEGNICLDKYCWSRYLNGKGNIKLKEKEILN